MKDEILSHLNNPRQLEKLYRSDKVAFNRAFSSLYPQLKGNTLAEVWNERLHYKSEEINWGTGRELLFVIIASLVAGMFAKIPFFTALNEDFFYSRNIGFIIFPALMTYFAWKNNLPPRKVALLIGLTLAGLIFINFLPDVQTSDTLILSCIHLLLFLWCILGIAFVGETQNKVEKRLRFLMYNGDLIVMTGLILIAGAVMTGITVGLFQLISFNITEFYFQNVVVFGLPAAPILGTYLTQANPNLVGKISPVIAKIFSPLVLVMLVIYLVAMVFSGKDPYNDREFLVIFNALLIGVMAIIFFSVAETFKSSSRRIETWILFMLSVVTVIVNGIALSAILFRISEWGITPNRAAVLGGNGLILLNLLFVTVQLYRVLFKKAEINNVGKAIAIYLPVYFFWTIIVTFLFPLIFGFK